MIVKYGFYSIMNYLDDFEDARINTRPDPVQFPWYNENDVIDIDQTVRWNREEVARKRQAYNDEKARLEKLQEDKYKEVNELVKNTVADHLMDSIKHYTENDAIDRAATIVDFAYKNMIDMDEGHEYFLNLVAVLTDFNRRIEGAV